MEKSVGAVYVDLPLRRVVGITPRAPSGWVRVRTRQGDCVVMFGVLVEVDNSGEDRDARIKGLREELAPAMKQTPGFQSGVFATNDSSGTGLMLVVYETRGQADAIVGRLQVGMSPRPGVTITRVEVIEVVATA